MRVSERKAAILGTAREHFGRYGYKRTRLDDIVRDVGIAKGSLYLDFAGKEELFLEIVLRHQRTAIAWFEALLASELTPAQRLRALLRFTFRRLQEEPLFARFQREDPEFVIFRRLLDRKGVPEMRDQTIQRMAELIVEGQRQGQFREELDPQLTPITLGLVKVYHFYTEFVEAAGFTREAFLNETIAMVMRSVLKPGIELPPEDEEQLPDWEQFEEVFYEEIEGPGAVS